MIINEIQKTREELLKEHCKQIVDISNATGVTYQTSIETIFNMFWNSEFTPQEIANFFGTDCVTIFQKHALAQAHLKQIIQDYQPLQRPAKYEVVVNQDGTITINEI